MQCDTEVLERIAACLRTAPRVSRAWLYGSRAKGLAKQDSDLDIGIELTVGIDVLSEWIVMSERLRGELNRAVGGNPPIHVELAHPRLAAEVVWPAIIDHGILIYDVRAS